MIPLYSLNYLLYLFFFNDTAPTEIYTLSLHDALPICLKKEFPEASVHAFTATATPRVREEILGQLGRSEEHTSELQSRENLVCRLLLEKKKKKKRQNGSV